MKTYKLELEHSEIQLLEDLLFNINPNKYADWQDDQGNTITEDYLNNLEDKINALRWQ